MTTEEKRNAIEAYCKAYADCDAGHKTVSGRCPLSRREGLCFSGYADIDGNYDHLVDSGVLSEPEPDATPTPEFDPVNRPKHYNREGAMESIDEMVLVFGPEAVMHFCLCNAWKYRYRATAKNGEEDLKKSDWYMRKYKELKEAGHDPT